MQSYRLDEALIADIETFVAGVRERHDGGPGSGNWGHLGRKGSRGGSAPGGGKQNRHDVPSLSGGGTKYSSWSKQRDRVAVPHKMSMKEYDSIPAGSIIVTKEGKRYVKKNPNSKVLKPADNPKGKGVHVKNLVDRAETRVALPKGANPNAQKNPTNRNEERRARLERTAHKETDQAADSKLRKSAGRDYSKMNARQKSALASYTGKGRRIMDRKMEKGEETGAYSGKIKSMKKALNNSTIDNDICVQEGMTSRQAMKRFGWDANKLNAAMNADRPSDILSGSVGAKKGVMSGKAGKGIKRDNGVIVHRNIRAGTNGIDTEPFASSGNGAGKNWDGKSGQSSFSSRHEVLLAPGQKEVVMRAWKESGVLHVETDVVPEND